MINPAVLDSASTNLVNARYHQWLDEARGATVNPRIHRLIDDLHEDLAALGPIDDDLGDVVRGALESVAAAIHTEDLLMLSGVPAVVGRHPAGASTRR